MSTVIFQHPLNPHNDLTAHSISSFQENEPPKNINDMFIHSTEISIAEPIDGQIDELGNNTIQMCQFIGIIHDEPEVWNHYKNI